MSKYRDSRVSKESRFEPNIEYLKEIVRKGNAQTLVEYANILGERFKQPFVDRFGKKKGELSSSQIRGVLDEIQRMIKPDRNTLQLLRPKLAYAAGRHGGRVKELYQVVEGAINLVEENNQQHFTNFKNFVEAIVAYHRLHGGE